MLTAVVIGIPIFFIVAGTLAALAFSVAAPEEPAAARPAARAAQEEPAELGLSLAQVPALWADALPASAATSSTSSTPVDELLAQIEAHLRRERQAAAAFAADPSSRALWLN